MYTINLQIVDSKYYNLIINYNYIKLITYLRMTMAEPISSTENNF